MEKRYIKKIHLIINIENEIDATFSLDFYHCLLDEKLWGVDWYNSAIFDASSYKQPVKFKDRNMRDKCFHLNN